MMTNMRRNIIKVSTLWRLIMEEGKVKYFILNDMKNLNILARMIKSHLDKTLLL